jgi:hypothetical protein
MSPLTAVLNGLVLCWYREEAGMTWPCKVPAKKPRRRL